MLLIVPTLSPALYGGKLTEKFVVATLAHGVSLSLPRTWEVLRGNESKALETAVGAAIDLSGYSSIVSGGESLLFAALPDATLYASISVTALPVSRISSNYASLLSRAELAQMAGPMRQGVEKTVARMGTKVWDWSALSVETLGRQKVIHTAYMRTSQFGDTQVNLYKFFSPGYVFDVALSTPKSSERINAPVLDRILKSIVVPQ